MIGDWTLKMTCKDEGISQFLTYYLCTMYIISAYIGIFKNLWNICVIFLKFKFITKYIFSPISRWLLGPEQEKRPLCVGAEKQIRTLRGPEVRHFRSRSMRRPVSGWTGKDARVRHSSNSRNKKQVLLHHFTMIFVTSKKKNGLIERWNFMTLFSFLDWCTKWF